jgi:hypothetical protein
MVFWGDILASVDPEAEPPEGESNYHTVPAYILQHSNAPITIH